MKLRSKVAVLMAEFLGTAILATVVINIARSQIGIGYFVALGTGLALAALVLLFGRVSGAHLNPAVTIALWTVRKISLIKGLSYIAVQMLGGLAAWQLANYFTGSEIMSIAPQEFEWTVLVAEAIGTFLLTFAIAVAIYQGFDEGKMAAVIGGGLLIGIIAASLASNAALNPAVALGNQTWSKAYAIGPIIGAVVGINLYVLLFAPASALTPRARVSGETAVADSSKSKARVVKSTTVKKTSTRKPATKAAVKKKTSTTRKK